LKRKDVKLLVVGKWYDLNYSLINGLENIHYYESRENISDFYDAADIFVLPSRTDSFPFTMLEAGLFKVALIGSNLGGISEFVNDRTDGLLFEKENTTMLTERIIELLDDEEMRNRLAESLNKKVNNLLDPIEYKKKLTIIYHNLLNENT
jgi:glycosyltransferase involved in cell wall biosynthesis